MAKYKRLNNKNTYVIKTNKRDYLVTMERLANTTYGAPRYEANVIIINCLQEYQYTASYRIIGSYLNEYDEAKRVVEEYEEGVEA